MFKVHRFVKGTTVTLLAALGVIMIVSAHGRSAPPAMRGGTDPVRAVQLRFTLDGGHWANVTQIEGGTITIEREGKKLAITPYVRDGNVELQIFKAVQNKGKETMETAGTLLVGKGLTKLEGNGLVLSVQVLDANKKLPSNLVAASAGATCCVRACDGTLICGVCVCTDCGRCGPGWCDCAPLQPPDVD